MSSKTKTRLLSAEDIFDLYGIDWLFTASYSTVDMDQEDRQIASFRLTEIRDAYVHACKDRIKAEARFLGMDLPEDFTFEQLMSKVRQRLGDSLSRGDLMRTATGGVNLMGQILQAHQQAGMDMGGIDLAKYGVKAAPSKPEDPDVDPNWFMSVDRGNGRIFDDPKWAEIAKAYVKVENAVTDQQILQAVDALNQLQHNSFHVLIDLQTGRMLNNYDNASSDRDARKRLQQVLDIKRNAKSIEDWIPEMSTEIRKLLHKYNKVVIQLQGRNK